MDIITQGLLGGVLAQSVAKEHEKKTAALVGVLAGLPADADILIRSAGDPLLNIEYHRHFTHSLLFIPLGAMLVFLFLWPLLRRRLPVGRLYLFCFAGFSMSGVLDACTSYGTHLFWPFTDERVAWNLISIVDPVFTLILLLALLVGLRLKAKPIAHIGLLLAAGYMGLAYLQQQRAEAQALAFIQAQGRQAERLVVKPTLGNLILWRTVYIHERRIYVNAVRVGVWSGKTVYEGGSVPLYSVSEALPKLDKHSTLYQDIQRFRDFSNGYIAVDPSLPHVLGDIRYSMLPTSTRPLWGIIINPEEPQKHADYRFFRDSSRESRTRFMEMLFD